MTETLTNLDNYVLHSALSSNEDGDSGFPGFWDEGFKMDILVHPYVFSTEEFISLGWPFAVFLEMKLLKMILSDKLKEQSLIELEKSFESCPTLFSTFLQIISRQKSIRFNIDFSDFQEAGEYSTLQRILHTTLILFPDSFEETNCKSTTGRIEYPAYKKFSVLIQDIVTGNPHYKTTLNNARKDG